MRILPYLFYLLLIAMFVVIFEDITYIYRAGINLPMFIVLAVALYKDARQATWFGFAAGIVAFAALPEVIGWHALFMAGLGFIAARVKVRLNLESLKAKLLLILGGVLVHNLLVVLVNHAQEFFTLLWSSALLGAVYTTAIAWVFFLFREGLITREKVKALF
ncbi:rod shape-determining protein MreD [candidate division GN15 bacterium]|nr:rod shape-determining protein MreD [candidate division GN15 bacterium]